MVRKFKTFFGEKSRPIHILFLGKEKFFTDGKYGGSGGDKWSDSVVKDNGNITKIELKEGGTINAIRVRYGNIWGDWHGVGGGSLQSIELDPGEYIKAIKGRTGGAVDGIEFHSSDNQVYLFWIMHSTT